MLDSTAVSNIFDNICGFILMIPLIVAIIAAGFLPYLLPKLLLQLASVL